MDSHLELDLRLKTESEYKSLYGWALNEVDHEGRAVDRDQIPWGWTLRFSAKNCSFVDQFEIEQPFSFGDDKKPEPKISAKQSIFCKLRSGVNYNNELEDTVSYSFFGTKRSIEDISLQIYPLEDANEPERCHAWGVISYTSEIDFQTELNPDCMGFYLFVKPERFSSYASLVKLRAIDGLTFHVGSVEGFYSDWSPSITTSSIKILLPGNDQKIDAPVGFADTIPRLGRVHKLNLCFHRKLEFAPPRDKAG